MRTTLDIDDFLDKELRKQANSRDLTYKDYINLVLGAGLKVLSKSAHSSPKYKFKVTPRACGMRPGVDIAHLNRAVDEIEDLERNEQ